MNRTLIKFLSGLAAFGVAASAHGLTIIPTFDSSITSDPNAALMEAAINSAIQVLETNIATPLTVNMTFVNDTGVALGENNTYYSDYNYSDYLAALKANATSHNDALALSQLTNSATDPVLGNSQIQMQIALAVAVGIDSSSTFSELPGPPTTVYLNMPLMNLTRPPGDPSKYDLQQVTEHEMDEGLGFVSSLPHFTSVINPVDLFRYTTNLSRTFITNGDNAYFSVDGTNLWVRFNMMAGGDLHDFWSFPDNDNLWAPPGTTPHPQVQDAYARQDVALDVATNELTGLDVIGYTLATPPAVPPVLTIATSGVGHFTLSWSPNGSGFTLQESTNLNSGLWANSATGSTNPAVVLNATARKFYRLYSAGGSPGVVARPAVVGPAKPLVYGIDVHVLHTRQP